jgi:hypothetical protein
MTIVWVYINTASSVVLWERPMRRIGSAIFICALWTVSAHGAEHCGEPSAVGIKRCEQIVTSKVDPTTNWETITYSDSNKEIVDLSITFSRKLGEPIYADALVGSSMMILSPELSQDGRRDLIIRLLQNADEGQSEFIVGGQIRVDLI